MHLARSEACHRSWACLSQNKDGVEQTMNRLKGGKLITELGDFGAGLFEAVEYTFYFLPFMETSNLGFPDDAF